MTHDYVKHCFIALTIEILIQGTVVGLVTYNYMIVYVCKCWYVMLVWLVFVWPRCWDKATHDSKIPAGHCYCSVQTPKWRCLESEAVFIQDNPLCLTENTKNTKGYYGEHVFTLGIKVYILGQTQGFPIVYYINTCLDSDVVSFGLC